ncbi:fibronectin type III domain-containing protein, partial [Owenweeksia hongkongensis]|uniref:fibronectin type III domain-containing protein n=1 Tax=Owenweeksia hongkongensis TaxID=253245 RepID=UPI003A94769E
MKKLLLLIGMVACWISPAMAQQNIALQATAAQSGGGAAAYGPANYNDGIIPVGAATTPWGWVSGGGWIEYTWPSAVNFQDIVFYHSNRKVTGGIIEYWDASTSSYVTVVGNLASLLAPGDVDSVSLPVRVNSTKLRFNNLTGSNPNFREIEVYEAPTGLHDAGVKSTSAVAAVCPGSYPVNVTIQNYGINQVDSVQVNWSVDGVLQTPVWHTSLLDTLGGTGLSEAVVAVGNYTYTVNTTYNLKSWTSLPNNSADTTNFNDTLNAQIALGAPTGFMASNVQTTSADLSWNTLGASNFRVTYGAAGFNPLTGGNTNPVTGSSTTLSGLSANTLYEAYLVADCGGSAYSDTTGPISFRTPCTVAIAPFNENF